MVKNITKWLLSLLLVMPFAMQNINAVETYIQYENEVQTQEEVQEQNPDHLEDYSEMYGYEPLGDEQKMVPLQSKARAATLPNAYIAVFIEFSDLNTIQLDNVETQSVANMIMNDGGKLTASSSVEKDIVSLKNYISKYSYNKMNLQTYFFPQQVDSTVKSYVAPEPSGYYKKYSASNPIGYNGSSQQAQREKELINGAIAAVQRNVENKVTAQQLDSDGNNDIDAISFFVESNPSLGDINWGDLLWSHKTNGYFSTTINGKSVNAYNLINVGNPKTVGSVFSYIVEPGTNQVKANRSSYGVIQHEFLHTLGLPDLYRGYDPNPLSAPVGYYDVMAQQIGDNPQAPTSLMRRDFLNWGSAIETINTPKSITLNKPKYIDPNEKNAIKIQSPLNAKEYFVVDYYTRQVNQSIYVGRGDGLIIYRVNNEQGYSNILGGTPGKDDYMYIYRPNEPKLRDALGTLSDAVILPTVGNTYGKALNEASTTEWDRDTIFFSDGSNSGIKINVTGATADTITFNVSLPAVSGSGSQSDPYLLYKADDFNLLRTYQGKYFKVMNDIDFKGIDFTPIESMRNHLDGQNYKLKNINITKDGGFFNSIDFDGSVKNLKFENINVSYTGDNHVGTVAASIGGSVENVQVLSGSAKGSSTLTSTYRGVGGFVGTTTNSAIIKNSFATVHTSNGKNVGGFVGLNQGATFIDCFANGLVENGSYSTGGFIGGEFKSGTDVFPDAINCAFDMAKTNQTKAQNGKDVKGITGYKVDSNSLTYYIEDINEFQISITTQPTTTFTKQVAFSTPNIVSYNESLNKYNILKIGTTNVIQGIVVGTHTMPLETKVDIKTKNLPIPITNMALNTTTKTLDVNATYKLTATITPSNTTERVVWSSSDANVASVDQSGNVKALKAGTTTISVTSPSGKVANCTITVPVPSVPITSISLSTTSKTMQVNSTYKLNATVAPNNTTEKVVWSSSNASVASIDQSGNVKALKAGTSTISVISPSGKVARCSINVFRQPIVNYRTHVQSDGWQAYRKDGEMAGTSGRRLRLEGININISNNDLGGGVEYSTHIQSIGWQDYKKDNVMSGTSGKALRLEGIKIRLYGGIANEYDIYYRVHAQSIGWLDWAKNGEVAGTAGLSYRLEAIEVRLVKKGNAAPGSTVRPYTSAKVNYQTHVQSIGWQSNMKNGEVAGTSGRRLRLEGIKINKIDDIAGDVLYRTHVQKIGWQPFMKNGEMSGTSGKALRLEAIEIKLTGELANKYDVYYRVHSQNFGWLGWAKNGASAGTAGYGYRLEAIQVMFVEKGGTPPGSTSNVFKQK